jgi:hypothetical protein
MPSNRVVTYVDLGLNTVEEYWDAVIVPNVKAFHTEHSRPSLFNASQSVWHMHDWVWHDRNPGENSRGPKFEAYRDKLLVDCPQLGWLRDIADAAKHRGMGRLPEVKGAAPKEEGRFRGLLALTENVRVFYLVLNDGSQEAADAVVRTAVAFWQEQLKERKLAAP